MAADLWPPAVTGGLTVGLLAFLTRGLHLDGLADTADALGSGAPAERALEIMKDSRTGAFGVMAVALLLYVKARGFECLAGRGSPEFFAIIPCLSRWGLCVLAVSSVYARKEGGLGRAFVGRDHRRALFLAGPAAFLAVWGVAGASWAFWSVLGAAGAGILASAFFLRRLGGVTGDVLGAYLEVLETLLVIVSVSFSGGANGA